MKQVQLLSFVAILFSIALTLSSVGCKRSYTEGIVVTMASNDSSRAILHVSYAYKQDWEGKPVQVIWDGITIFSGHLRFSTSVPEPWFMEIACTNGLHILEVKRAGNHKSLALTLGEQPQHVLIYLDPLSLRDLGTKPVFQ